MNTSRIGLAGALLLASSLALAQAPPADPATGAAPAAPAQKLEFTDDYQIVVNHDAESDGEIIFRVTWKDGKSKDITVTIKKGTGENAVAREIKKAFDKQLGTKHYNIEMEDGETVIIERSGGKLDTSLVLVSSTVMGITVKVRKD
jgi:hypothetical protein